MRPTRPSHALRTLLLAAAFGSGAGCADRSSTATEIYTGALGPVHSPCPSFLLAYGPAVGDTIDTASGLRYIEIQPGSGNAAASGMVTDVNYSGYLMSGSRFDTSCPSGQTVLRVTLGASEVIPGFEQGITGMRVGGVRRIIMPPALGYGSTAVGPIPANSTLVFDIQLVRFAAR